MLYLYHREQKEVFYIGNKSEYADCMCQAPYSLLKARQPSNMQGGDNVCYGCKHLWEDRSVGAFDCTKAENMTEAEFEVYFVDDKDGCPYYEELVEEDYKLEV